MIGALAAAQIELGPDRKWNAVNSMQKRFIAEFLDPNLGIIGSVPEVSGICSRSADVINKFLADRGYSIRLGQFDPEEFGVASALDLLVEWMESGVRQNIIPFGGKIYDGFRLKSHCLAFYRKTGHPNPIVEIATQNGDSVFVTMLDESLSDFALVDKVSELFSGLRVTNEFEGLVIPMITLKQEVNISWMLRMNTVDDKGTPAWISQAKQETRLRMNEFGARVQSAVALGMKRLLAAPVKSKPDHIIDKPFLMWIMRRGLSIPMFVGHLTYDDWKDPGNITKD